MLNRSGTSPIPALHRNKRKLVFTSEQIIMREINNCRTGVISLKLVQ
jgi:hypothetical protein